MILFSLILLLLILLIYLYYHRFSSSFSSPLSFSELFTNSPASSFYKCVEKPVLPAIEEIFREYRIQPGSSKKWDLYIPCGYTYVESELPGVVIPSKGFTYVFGINGCDEMVSKNNLWTLLQETYGFEKAATIMPASYVYRVSHDMARFQKEYRPGDIYILKKNIQRKEGLKLTRDRDEILNAGKKEDYVVIQTYLRDLYLIQGYKVNLRLYLLVTVIGPEIRFYLCREGKCIYTKKKVDDANQQGDGDLDFESNITSYHLDMEIYKTNPRTLSDLEVYIEADRPGAYEPFLQVIRQQVQSMCMAVKDRFYQSENFLKEDPTESPTVNFQLFGIDMIMDNQLHPYILEVNKGPDMTGRDEVDESLKKEIQKHLFEKVGVIQDPAIHETNLFEPLE